MTLEEVVRKKLALLKARIDRGRGKQYDTRYVQDSIWTKIHTEKRVLESSLRRAGL